jgi:hypothetical protein
MQCQFPPNKKYSLPHTIALQPMEFQVQPNKKHSIPDTIALQPMELQFQPKVTGLDMPKTENSIGWSPMVSGRECISVRLKLKLHRLKHDGISGPGNLVRPKLTLHRLKPDGI